MKSRRRVGCPRLCWFTPVERTGDDTPLVDLECFVVGHPGTRIQSDRFLPLKPGCFLAQTYGHWTPFIWQQVWQALAIYSHVNSKVFSWLHVGCTNITKQAFAAFTIADIATINHSAPSGTRVSASRPHRSFRHLGSTRTEPDRRAHRALLQLVQPSRVRVHLEATVDRPRPLWGPVRSTSAPSGTRTHTVPILSRLPLPIGLWGQRKLRWCSLSRPPDVDSRKHQVPARTITLANTEVNSRACRRIPNTRPCSPVRKLHSIESKRCGTALCLHAVRSPT